MARLWSECGVGQACSELLSTSWQHLMAPKASLRTSHILHGTKQHPEAMGVMKHSTNLH